MKNYLLDSHDDEQPIIVGYFGAITVIVFLFINSFFGLEDIKLFKSSLNREDLLFIMIVTTFIFMVLTEYFSKRSCVTNNWTKYLETKKKNLHLIVSTFYRFNTLLIVFYLMFFVVNKHQYFSDNSFEVTRKFFFNFLSIYLFLGIPYIFFTLKYRWSIRYEFNDYSINLMIVFKGVIYFIWGSLLNKNYYLKKSKQILFSKRAKKIFLIYLVIFFFLTLMIKFLGSEFDEFNKAVNVALNLNNNSTFFAQYTAWYSMFYHLLFILDISLAIIGYTFASRWLNNRTQSVDMTMGGWVVTMMCYPPLNSGFTGKFINYSSPDNHVFIASETGEMIIMAFNLLLITIYVWATVALSFKFSNLTNKGIVTTGPYSIVRHPAYVAKNLSWWLDNKYVLLNFWSAVALFFWNIIYILRALTEERHLKKDLKYQAYCKKVKYKFIPGLF